jgi:predicted CXXCH cytochrome family protein
MTRRVWSWAATDLVWRVRLLLSLAVCAAVITGLFTFASGRASSLDKEEAPDDGVAASPPDRQQESTLACMVGCHDDPELAMTFPNGDVLPLYFDVAAYHGSVHGERLDCLDCHQRHNDYPHPDIEARSRRDYAWAEYEACKRCHLENYTLTLDSMHFDTLAAGDTDAAICTDCHTAHTVTPMEGSRTSIPKTCSTCHGEIYESYAESVHGSALREENPDVPDCIACHGVHNIASATTSSFRQGSVDLCAGCHGNEELMDRYDISSNVLKTYLDDYHGKTVGFYQSQSSEVWPDVAVCSDCHGIHDIKAADDPESSVVKQNLVTTCRKCHQDATANFPSAWLSHYEPDIRNAPLVYFVVVYYKILIPVMVVGLGLNVALDMWRLARNR